MNAFISRAQLEQHADGLRQFADQARNQAPGQHSDFLDRAQAVRDQARNDVLRRLFTETQEQVSRALDRMSYGLYGICEDCSARISRDRLQMLPQATRCIDCQWECDRALGRCA